MAEPFFLPHDRLDDLIRLLAERGYRVVGPYVREGVITYGELDGAAQLPWGFRDEQQPGRYRLAPSDAPRSFAWANGPQAVKPFLFAPREPLWRARRVEGRMEVEALLPEARPLAFLGVRACDLAALAMHGRHFLGGTHPDPCYAVRSDKMLLIAVDCTHPAETCFCVSTGDGPAAQAGFDLALTEITGGFLARAGSLEGRDLLHALDLAAAQARQVEEAEGALASAAARQTRRLPKEDLAAALFARLDHPRWEEVAGRCLACGNCTQVCPTCFCHGEEDVPAPDGCTSVHERYWDSCFTAGHAWLHGFQVRPEIRHRYRQWLTHKLAGWHAQFGRSGCVGCGRCITWCPVGIDLTVETAALLGETRDAG